MASTLSYVAEKNEQEKLDYQQEKLDRGDVLAMRRLLSPRTII